MPGPPKITLDQESFKALASEVRVEILKRLDDRRQTVTDLSNFLSLSKPTLLEHLEKLQAAGLVKRLEEGRKWIYYELSDKGRKILRPERVAIVLALGNAAALVALGIVALLLSANVGFLAAPGGLNPARGVPAPTVENGAAAYGLDAASFGWFALLTFVFAALSIGVALLLIRMQRRRTRDLFARVALG